MDTFSEESALPFSINGGQLFKERICSSRSKFFPLRVDPILEELCCPWKQSGSHKSCFEKMVDNCGDISICLRKKIVKKKI